MTAKELKLDYFKFYDVENHEAEGEILLRGQFDQHDQKMRLRLLDFFANPVSKNGEPLYNKKAHLAWYRGVSRRNLCGVVLENQFGKVVSHCAAFGSISSWPLFIHTGRAGNEWETCKDFGDNTLWIIMKRAVAAHIPAARRILRPGTTRSNGTRRQGELI